MIKKEKLEIISVTPIATDTVEMVLKNDYISDRAVPGQFLHISVIGHTLRRPISIASINKETQTITIVFKMIGTGTESLANYRIGEFLDVLGPSGNGFPTDDMKEDSSILLIGGGIGIPPIYFLATNLKKLGVKVQTILGFQSKEYMFYRKEFEALGKTLFVTNDGSFGHKGYVTDVFDQLEPFDRYYSCGPLPMLKAVVSRLKDKEGYLSFEERMGCGVGACYACVIPSTSKAGFQKICQDGPVFRASEVIL